MIPPNERLEISVDVFVMSWSTNQDLIKSSTNVSKAAWARKSALHYLCADHCCYATLIEEHLVFNKRPLQVPNYELLHQI